MYRLIEIERTNPIALLRRLNSPLGADLGKACACLPPPNHLTRQFGQRAA